MFDKASFLTAVDPGLTLKQRSRTPTLEAQAMVDFVGMDNLSPKNECPAVFVDPATRAAYYQGRLVTDPEALAKFAAHSPLAADEAVVWHPPNMAQHVIDALTGNYEPGRKGHGESSFQELVDSSERSVVHLEARDTYDATDPAFLKWQQDGDTAYEWDDWIELVGSAVARRVKFRRLRIVSEPVSDYIRWEHAISYGNVKAGEELRWLPRRLAFDLPVPVADFYMFDQRLVRYNFTAGDGKGLGVYEYVTDPRAIVPLVGWFEMLWERAIPHEHYTPA